MRKEFVVAIFLGLTVGLLIVVGILVARQAFEKHQSGPDNTIKTIKPSPISTSLSAGSTTVTPLSGVNGTLSVPTPTPSKHSVIIDRPEENSVFSSSELIISGKTTPLSTIAIVSEKNEYFTTADEAGLFSQKVELITGVNEIKVASVASNDEQAEIILTVVYTTAEF